MSLSLGGHAQAPVTQEASFSTSKRDALSVVHCSLGREHLVFVSGITVLFQQSSCKFAAFACNVRGWAGEGPCCFG